MLDGVDDIGLHIPASFGLRACSSHCVSSNWLVSSRAVVRTASVRQPIPDPHFVFQIVVSLLQALRHPRTVHPQQGTLFPPVRKPASLPIGIVTKWRRIWRNW